MAVRIPAEQMLRCAARGFVEALECGELYGLSPSHVAGRPVAHEHLHRRGQRRDRQRDRQRGALVASPATAKAAERIRRRHYESRNNVGGEIHVDQLVPQEAVAEQRGERMHVHHLARAEPEARRVLHPRVDRDHHERAGEARDRDRDPAREVRPR